MRQLFVLSLAAIAAAAMPAPASAQTSVPLAHFDGIQLRGGGHVVLRHGAVQSVTLLKGSLTYTSFKIEDGGTLKIDACNSDCPHIYDLEIEIVTPSIEDVAVKGGGAIASQDDFAGQQSLAAAVSGGGHIDIRAIKAEEVDAAVNGGGHIDLFAKHALNSAVNGGGKIVYWGEPKLFTAINGGGSVSKGS